MLNVMDDVIGTLLFFTPTSVSIPTPEGLVSFYSLEADMGV